MNGIEPLLNALTPDFWWFRDSHYVSGGKLRVQGTFLISDRYSPSDVKCYVDGQQIDVSAPVRSDYADRAFWFAPESRRFGLVIEHPVRNEQDAISVTFSPNGPAPEFTSGQYVRWQEIEPTPPITNIERVSGKGATAYNYHNNGLTDFLRFSGVARQYGVDITSPEVSVLDWGCGCARLTRHFIDAAGDKNNVKGVDIDPDNVAWSNQNIRDGAFTQVRLFPPTPFPDASFDLIFANSVLSHLKLDAMGLWLAEVARLLKPGGLALLSYHGKFSIAAVTGRSADFAKRILQTGFNSDMRARELEGFIPDPEYYRQTFMSDDFSISLFTQHLSLRTVKHGMVSRYQNVAVLSR